MPPQKRKHLTIEDRKKLIDEKDAGKSVDDLVSRFAISKSEVYKILNDRKSIVDKIDEGVNPKKKRMKIADNDFDDAVLSWFKAHRSNNIPINGPLIQVSLSLRFQFLFNFFRKKRKQLRKS